MKHYENNAVALDLEDDKKIERPRGRLSELEIVLVLDAMLNA